MQNIYAEQKVNYIRQWCSGLKNWKVNLKMSFKNAKYESSAVRMEWVKAFFIIMHYISIVYTFGNNIPSVIYIYTNFIYLLRNT